MDNNVGVKMSDLVDLTYAGIIIIGGLIGYVKAGRSDFSIVIFLAFWFNDLWLSPGYYLALLKSLWMLCLFRKCSRLV